MSPDFSVILNYILLLNVPLMVTVIILERRRPEKTIAWILIFSFIPLLGIFVYLIFGVSKKRKKVKQNLTSRYRDIMFEVLNYEQIKNVKPLINMLARDNDSPLFVNNDVTVFKDGNEKFAVLKEKMLEAKHHIHVEYYIFNSDKIGNEIKDILIKKAKEGLEVRIIVDKIGSFKTSRKLFKDLKKAGVKIAHYAYLVSPFLNEVRLHINNRNHRKIVVIDGKIGFVGGINVGDEYLGKGKLGYWRDTHIMVEGDFVIGLQTIFFTDYMKILRIKNPRYLINNEEEEKYFPVVEQKGGTLMQFAASGPDSIHPSVLYVFLKMIMNARKNIYITTPYFIPSESLLDALKIAAISGIDVRILFPGQADHKIVYEASITYLTELIKSGIKVYFYDKDSFLHAKTITVDGKYCTVGTTNLDIRSFNLNYEVNAVIYDEKVTKELEELFINDLSKSRIFTIEDFKKMSFARKMFQSITRLFSTIL